MSHFFVRAARGTTIVVWLAIASVAGGCRGPLAGRFPETSGSGAESVAASSSGPDGAAPIETSTHEDVSELPAEHNRAHAMDPAEAIASSTDPDPQVRIAGITALGGGRPAEAHRHLTAALGDHNLRVRIAAVRALGDLGGSEAQATLEQLLKNQSELVRVAAVSALAELGAEQAVISAAGDPSWRVRSAVARALARYPHAQSAALARELLDDPSPVVQWELTDAVASWPLEKAGPVLLEAMSRSGYLTRQNAARQLAQRWPPAAEFAVDGPLEERTDTLQHLRHRFEQEYGLVEPDLRHLAADASDQSAVAPKTVAAVEHWIEQLSAPTLPQSVRTKAAEAMVGFGPELVAALEELSAAQPEPLPEPVYRSVLPRCDPVFDELNRLTSDEVSVRRQAADRLAAMAGGRRLGRLALARLAFVAANEPDPLVWQGLLTAVADDPSDLSVGIAYTAIEHPSAEVRRRACEHLAAHPQASHAAVLLPALDDENRTVRVAAVRALARTGRLEDTQPLRRLLASSDEPLRVEAAAALCRLKDPSGPAALERLARSNDPAVRRRAAEVMGRIGDPSFTATLIGLLDDRQSIRLAALDSLPEVVGRDVTAADGQQSPGSSGRIRGWKQWFDRRGSVVSKD